MQIKFKPCAVMIDGMTRCGRNGVVKRGNYFVCRNHRRMLRVRFYDGVEEKPVELKTKRDDQDGVQT